MPFQKGQPRPAGAGRKKKSGANAARETVKQTLQRLDCNPIQELITLAQETKSEQLKGRIYMELAQYEHPKLRSMELSGPAGSAIEVKSVSPAELLLSRINSIAARIAESGSPKQS